MPDDDNVIYAPGTPPLLFVSYTPADESWASWIAWELEASGYRVVLQAWDFIPGTNFVDFMDRGVAGAAAVIAVLSRSYLSSRFGRWEWQSAILANPDDPAAKLITVRVEECPLEGLLSTITYVDLVGVRDQREAREQLLRRIAQALAGRAKPAIPPAFPPASLAAVPREAARAEAVPEQRAQPRRRPASRPAYPPAQEEPAPHRDGVAVLHVPGPRFGRGLPEPGVPSTASDLQARIWADVTRLVDAGAPRPDLLVVSGDLTESGSLREFDEAVTFMTGLRALLGLEPERCVIVPGSHDITRRACEGYFADCEADDIEPRPPYWPKWRHFSRVFDEFYRDIEGVIFDRSQPWTFFAVPGLRVVVAGLNSTVAESHRPEDRFGLVGEAQAAWFAERLREYAREGWLRLGAVAHDPEILRDAHAAGELLGTRLNVLLHGASGKDGTPFYRTGDPGSGSFAISSAGADGGAGVLTVPAGGPGQHEILHLTAEGMTRWRPGQGTGKVSREETSCGWHSATATFPPPAAPPGPGADAEAEASQGQGGPPGPPDADEDPDLVSGRAASPALRLLDQIAEVVEAGHPDAKLKRVTADGPPHLLVTEAEGGFIRQWRVAAHAGEMTREVVDEFAVVLHSGEPEDRAELVCAGPRPPQGLRAEALRRGIKVLSFTEFQGLLDLRDYVEKQTARLQSDQRYPHDLYVPQRFRELEAHGGQPGGDDLVAELLSELTTDAGRFILLLADFGRGKTFALRELARHIPARLPHLVPIYIELRELDKAHSVDGLIAAHLANHGEKHIDLKAFRYMLAQGRIVLLFDGFDELATRVTFDRAADHLQTLLSAADGKAKIVVASRTQHFKSDAQVFTALGERVGLLPGRRVLGIEDFDGDQISAYLRNWYQEETAASERLRLISDVGNLLGLSSNPRMLSFIAQLDADRVRAVASAGHSLSGADLYRAILDAWLRYEHERAHGIPGAPAGLTLGDLWRSVTVLAMRLNESGETLIRLSELAAEVATSLAGLASGRLTAEQSVHAIGAGSLLVRVEEGSEPMFGFIHSSVAEWLVANETAARLAASGGDGDGNGADGAVALARRTLSQLTIDFLCDLAVPAALRKWMAGVLADPGSASVARTNAMRVNARLRVPASTDLRGAILRGEDLSHRDLDRVDFTGADLTGARLVGTNLSGAVLARVRLNGARLDGARLDGADLSGADLRGARLTRAHLSGARFDGSKWSRAALIDVVGLPGGGRLPELRGAAIVPGQPVDTEFAPAVIGVPYGYLPRTARLPRPLAYNADGSLLAIGNADGGVSLCDTSTGLLVRTLRGHGGRVYGVGYGAGDQDQVLVTAASDATVRLWDTITGQCTRVIEVGDPGAWPVTMSSDGRFLAYGAPDGIVRLMDIAAGSVERELPGHATPVYAAAFGSLSGDSLSGDSFSGAGLSAGAAAAGSALGDGQVFITGDYMGTIRIWDLATGALRAQFTAGPGPVYRTLPCASGPYPQGAGATVFAVGGDAGTLLLLDARGRATADLPGHTGAVYALAYHPGRRLLASGCTDGGVRLWNTEDRTLRAVLPPHPGALYGLSFSPDGELLASASNDGLVRITSVSDGGIRHELTAHKSAVWRPLFSPDGKQLATGSNDLTCRLWDTATGQARHVLRGHGRRVTSVTFSSDGALLAAGGGDGVVRVWDPVTGQQRHALTGTGDRLVSAVFGPEPELLAAASNDGGVYLWNASTGTQEREMNVETERVWAETFSPDGEVLATANDDDSVRLWYRSTGRNTLTITEHKGRVRSLAFSPSGDLLATGCDDRKVRVWDTDGGQLRAMMEGHADRVYAVAFSPDGRLLASAGNDGLAFLWDPATGAQVRELAVSDSNPGDGNPGGGKLWTMAFSPDGDTLAAAGDDGIIRLWSVPDGALSRSLPGHADRVAAVAFSPAGRLLASASDDGTVRIWDLAAPGPALRMTLLGADMGWAAFSPDGRYKHDGYITGQFWHVVGACRFEPGELDTYLPAIQRLPADAPF